MIRIKAAAVTEQYRAAEESVWYYHVIVTPPGRPQANGARQPSTALLKNAKFFAENVDYKTAQKRLEHYRLIAQAASHETSHSQTLLDIGNGGLFDTRSNTSGASWRSMCLWRKTSRRNIRGSSGVR